jgi:hypothetical protein
MRTRTIAAVLAVSMVGTGCFRGGRGLGLFEAALVTAVIISAVAPPPPRVVFVPAPREGYVWQAGYWTRTNDDWVWVDGQWIEQRPSYQWMPTHWEQGGDGNWHLVQGQWVPA